MFWGKNPAALAVVSIIAISLPLLSAASAVAAPERRISEKRAVLTSSISGYPKAGAPANRQLKRANVFVRYYDDGAVALEADVRVKADAETSEAQVYVGIGQFQGNDCKVDNGKRHYAIDRLPDDDRYWLWNSNMPSSTAFNCAVVQVQDGTGVPSTQVYDGMVGRLTDTYVQPKLALSKPRLLGKAKKKLKLVRGVAQKHEIVVRNTGKYRARNVVLTGRGKGIKAVNKKVGTIAPGDSAAVTVPVRLKSKAKRTKVRFTVSGSGVKASRTVKVRAVKAPARPAAGKWRSPGKDFTFTVKKGKIAKFRGINLRMTCGGGFSGYRTYQTVNLAFPKVKVPRHGYIDASKKWRKGNSWYNASLSGRITGKKLTQARFTYSAAGNCSVVERFTARRR